MKRVGLLALALIACGAVIGVSARAQDTRAAAETRPGEFVYQIPPEGITLEMLAHDAEVATGRTFILTDKSPLRGKTIRLVGEARVPRDQVMTLFQALFVTQGYALKPLGESAKRILVVESIDTAIDLKQRATFVSPGDVDAWRHEVGSVIMTFFPLRHVKVANVRAALAPILVSKTVEIVLDVESANALLIFGFAPTVYAIKQLIGAMDVPQPGTDLRFELLTLAHGVAEEIEPVVADLIQANPRVTPTPGRGGSAPGGVLPGGVDKPAPKVVADPRLNALAVYAVPSDMEEIRKLVEMLDQESKEPAQNIRIYRLKHTNAEDVADVLSDTLSGRSRGGGGGASDRGGGSPPGLGGVPGAGTPRGGTSGGDDVIIAPEPHNNALLIRCSRSRWDEIRPIIEELDRRRPQVIIQAVVAELTDDQFKSIGSEFTALEGGDGWRLGALSGFGLSEIGIASSGSITGSGPGSGTGTGGGGGGPGFHAPAGEPNLFRLPVFPGDPITNRGGIFGFFNENLNVPFLLQLLQNKQRGNLLTAPVVLANDNQQSKIEAGVSVATVGFTAGGVSQGGGVDEQGNVTTFTGAGTGDTFQFSGYQEAKISLTISPHISSDDYVRLEVELLVEAFLPLAAPESRATRPPDKTSRKLVGAVTIRNAATVVVGGLVLNRDRSERGAVPPFADAPMLEPFFSVRRGLCERGNIYFFLTPTIISTFDTLDHVSYAKKLEIEKLDGNVRILDPNFRPVLLDSRRVVIDQIEESGNLDVPRYSPILPMEECRPARLLPQEAPGGSR